MADPRQPTLGRVYREVKGGCTCSKIPSLPMNACPSPSLHSPCTPGKPAAWGAPSQRDTKVTTGRRVTTAL